MVQAGLVLEGGGMKGIYTAGVLEFFLEKGLSFSSVYGVSAGACHMCSYISGQKNRARDIAVDYLDSKYYCGVESLLFTGDLFNVDTCYHLIPDYLSPYDYEAAHKYPGKVYSVVTNIVTGKPEYLEVKDMKKDIDMIRASASLPLVSRNVEINGNLYLDGGISDAIPIRQSLRHKNKKNVVIMTKEEGYVRKPASVSQLALLKARYIKYPKVAHLMQIRHLRYNRTVDFLYEQQEKGRAFVIRPKQASQVKRIEKDKDKMLALYEEGYRDAADCWPQLCEYLGIENPDSAEHSNE